MATIFYGEKGVILRTVAEDAIVGALAEDDPAVMKRVLAGLMKDKLAMTAPQIKAAFDAAAAVKA